MAQKYWITTQWPQYVGKQDDLDIELQYKHRDAGQELEKDDLIFIYELRTGRVGKGFGKREKGKRGIIALVKANSGFEENPSEECRTFYDGQKETKMYWKWCAKIKHISKNGFVPREKVNEILGYKSNYTLRGFGKMGSGLKRITKEQFCQLLKLFNSNQYKIYC